MKSVSALPFLLLLLGAAVVGQSALPPDQATTAHIQGTIKDQTGAPFSNIKVTFQSDVLKKTVTTNGAGEYEAGLPVGRYTMDVTASGFRRYHRPWFSLESQAKVTFDVTLPVTSTCHVEIVSTSGPPAPTEEQKKAAIEEACIREELLTVPAKTGAPFQLFVRYEKRTFSKGGNEYFGDTGPLIDPVLVVYNLFSLQADEVLYRPKTQTIEASGRVVVEDQSGKRTAAWMSFKLEDGKVTPVH